jgi:hypothetical protein
MTAAAPCRSQHLRAKLALVRGYSHRRRAAAFRTHVQNIPPAQYAFNSIAALPNWLLWNEEAQDRLAAIIALKLHRNAIDQELSGTKLAAVSAVVGEAIFDALCDAPLEEGQDLTNELPRPEDLVNMGRQYMQRSIPIVFATQFPGATGDSEAIKLCLKAMALLQSVEAAT